MAKRPAKVVVDPLRARVVRGPHKDGSGRWYWRVVSYRGEGGAERTIEAGWYTRQEVAARMVDLVASGEHEVPRDDALRTVSTVRDLLECWVAYTLARPNLSPGYQAAARNAARLVARMIGDVSLRRLDAGVLDGYRDDRLRGGAASGTVIRDLKVLRSAWVWGRRRELVSGELPPVLVKHAAPARRVDRVPTVEEVRRVIAAMHPNRWPRPFTMVLFATGMRLGEAAALRWGDLDIDIDSERPCLRVRGEEWGARKTGARTIAIPLHADTAAELRRWRGDQQPDAAEGVWGVLQGSITNNYGNRQLDKACDRADVERFTPNNLRDLAIRWLYRTTDPGTARAIAGHSAATALRFYHKAHGDDALAAMQATPLGSLTDPEGTVLPFRKGS